MIHLDQDKLKHIQTPAYYYDMEVLRATLEELKKQNTEGYVLHYALKANNDKRVLAMIQSYGHGADCVSSGEIERALETGFSPDKIVFAGVGKSDVEIRYALTQRIGYIHVESLQEIEVLGELAAKEGIVQKVLLRINPQIDAHTHAHITTGLAENKFGIALGDISTALFTIQNTASLEFVGIHFHIGSQIEEMDIFEILSKRALEVASDIEKQGYRISIINVGGGLGVDYITPHTNTIPDFAGYFRALKKNIVIEDGMQIHFEFGRAMVAQCGVVVSRVLFTKEAGEKHVVVLDAGMTELMRPALYGAEHYMENISSALPEKKYTIVGPICETTDTFREDYMLPETTRGDMIAIYSAGAYGQTMSSEYNLRPRARTYYSDEL